MEKSYRIVSLGGGASISQTDNQIPSILANYITLLLQLRTDIKLFHWKTGSFAHHKISDELLSSIDGLSDKLVESICGVYGIRPEMENQLIRITNISEVSKMVSAIKLVGFELRKQTPVLENTEIANIRDELLDSMDKALYLLSFN